MRRVSLSYAGVLSWGVGCCVPLRGFLADWAGLYLSVAMSSRGRAQATVLGSPW